MSGKTPPLCIVHGFWSGIVMLLENVVYRCPMESGHMICGGWVAGQGQVKLEVVGRVEREWLQMLFGEQWIMYC